MAIFSVDEPRRAREVAPASTHSGGTGPARLAQLLDTPYAVVALAVALVVILVLGLIFARH